jgi:hypothetical protein
LKYVLLQDGEPFDLIEVRITYMKFVLTFKELTNDGRQVMAKAHIALGKVS